jgi:hypothetical protein
MKTTKYIGFKEDNEWEGESWKVYFPIGGNEEAIEIIKKHIEELDCYSFSSKQFDYDYVKEKDENSGYGYMKKHTLIDKKFDMNKIQKYIIDDTNNDNLYKGGISQLFIEE